MLTLETFLIILLAGAAAVTIAGFARPRHAVSVALAALAVTTVLWLLAAGQLPLSFAVDAPLAPAVDFTWIWQVQRPLWLLSLALFLLQLGALLYFRAWVTPEQRAERARFVMLMGAAAHLAFWAASLVALATVWSLLALLWGLDRGESAAGGRNAQAAPGRATRYVVAIFLLWLAAAAGASQSGAAGWPPLAASLILLAIVVQLSVAPVAVQQLSGRQDRATFTMLLHLLSAVAGAALLLRLKAAGDEGLGFALPLTLAGLLALLFAGRRAWSAMGYPGYMAPALVMAEAGFILLTGVWASPEAVLAETRVLLLGGGLLTLTAPRAHSQDDPGDDGHIVAAVARLVALGALLGLPLTAGFQGRTALYGAWAADGRWLLLLVTALLHLPLTVAGLRTLLRHLPSMRSPAEIDRNELVRSAGLLPPALGLLGAAGLANATTVAWPAVLAPLLLAWPLARFLPETKDIERTIRQAFQLRIPARPVALARRAQSGAGQALREAALVLEGESGLLWLLLFLVILWLAR